MKATDEKWDLMLLPDDLPSGYIGDRHTIVFGEPLKKVQYNKERKPQAKIFFNEIVQKIENGKAEPAELEYYFLQTSSVNAISIKPIPTYKPDKWENPPVPEALFKVNSHYVCLDQFESNKIYNRFPDAVPYVIDDIYIAFKDHNKVCGICAVLKHEEIIKEPPLLNAEAFKWFKEQVYSRVK